MVSIIIKVLILTTATRPSASSVGGISYMDPLNFKPLPDPPGSNPCNPLYWYPREIPEYCYLPKPKMVASVPQTSIPIPAPVPVPVPVPLPIPLPQPMPPPMPLPFPMPPALSPAMGPPIQMMGSPFGMPPPMSLPFPMRPALSPAMGPPLQTIASPFGMPPYAPSYPPIQTSNQIGMVPGIPGLVSSDGGINILPFSDAYSDILEKHKNKLIRQRYRKILQDYEDFPRRIRMRKHRRRRKKY